MRATFCFALAEVFLTIARATVSIANFIERRAYSFDRFGDGTWRVSKRDRG